MVMDRNWDMEDVEAFLPRTRAEVMRDAILDDVIAERKSQDAKWGDQSSLPRERMLAVLMEEVGEVAEAILANGKPRDLRAELVQVAAVAVWMIEHIDGKESGNHD